MGKEFETLKETLFAQARLYFILKTMEESYGFENAQNGDVLEVLCKNVDEVWNLLERLSEKVFDKPLTYDKNEPYRWRKCFAEMKEHDFILCQ